MKILVVDDDQQILDALTITFELQWQDAEVIPAIDGHAGLNAFFDHVPDIVVLDVVMPGRNGFEVLREIRRVSDVPVIMLTARGAETDHVRGLELGADDYLAKPFSNLALLAHIKAVLRRAELPPPLQAQPDIVIGDLAISFQSQEVTRRGEVISLTGAESRVLVHLVRNTGRVLPHQALLDRAWGPEQAATTENLKVIISRLRAKLEEPAGPRYIETVRGVGYRFNRPPEVEVRPARPVSTEPV